MAIFNVRRFQRAVRRFSVRFRADVRREGLQVLELMGRDLLGRVKLVTPVDTGRLKRSLTYRITGTNLQIYTDTPYAKFVDLGTRFMRPRNYFRPNVDRYMRDDRYVQSFERYV